MNVSRIALLVLGFSVLNATSIAALAESVKRCSSYLDEQLRSTPTGFRCSASKGDIWEKVSSPSSLSGESWKSQDGLVWGDLVTLNHKAAFKWCDAIGYDSKKTLPGTPRKYDIQLLCEKGTHLPTRDEFKSCVPNECRSVLPHMKNKKYWVSAVHHNIYPFIFETDNGSVYYDKGIYVCGAKLEVRCVSGP